MRFRLRQWRGIRGDRRNGIEAHGNVLGVARGDVAVDRDRVAVVGQYQIVKTEMACYVNSCLQLRLVNPPQVKGKTTRLPA